MNTAFSPGHGWMASLPAGGTPVLFLSSVSNECWDLPTAPDLQFRIRCKGKKKRNK